MDFTKLCLGRQDARPGAPKPALRDFTRISAPPVTPPPAVDWAAAVPPGSYRMFLNDHLGCCTIAACANALITWTANTQGGPWIVGDDVILRRYSELTGYQLGEGTTDRGAIEADVLAAWTTGGWDVGRQDIDCILHASVRPIDHVEVKNAIHLFGGLYIGIALPLAAQTEATWDVLPGIDPDQARPGSWGGHAVYVVAYDAEGLTCVTWGALKRMTWAFWDAYCDEAWALLSRSDWLDVHGKGAGSYDFDALRAALESA